MKEEWAVSLKTRYATVTLRPKSMSDLHCLLLRSFFIVASISISLCRDSWFLAAFSRLDISLQIRWFVREETIGHVTVDLKVLALNALLTATISIQGVYGFLLTPANTAWIGCWVKRNPVDRHWFLALLNSPLEKLALCQDPWGWWGLHTQLYF